MNTHQYQIQLEWTGNRGSGTLDYRAYSRDHEITGLDKMLAIPGTSDPDFRGDAKRYNPEELLVASLSACHMLWYLHLCAINGIVVISYQDQAKGLMQENTDGSGQFESVTLRPQVQVSDAGMIERAKSLHTEAHDKCFISSSVRFTVGCEAEVWSV